MAIKHMVFITSEARLQSETTYLYDLGTSPCFPKFLKEQPSTTSNFDPVMAERLPDLQEIHALLKPRLVTRSVFECHPVPSRNFQAIAEQPSVCSLVMAAMKCHCELQVLLITKPRLVVNSSRT